MSFAMRLAGHATGPELTTAWEDPDPTEEKELLANILLRKEIGISTGQALKEAGYGNEDADEMQTSVVTG